MQSLIISCVDCDRNTASVSEIAVVGCAFPPSLAWGNMCKPETTSEKDAIKGKWVRVGGNLNAESSLYYIVCTPLSRPLYSLSAET